jgi:hypothetical protein
LRKISRRKNRSFGHADVHVRETCRSKSSLSTASNVGGDAMYRMQLPRSAACRSETAAKSFLSRLSWAHFER